MEKEITGYINDSRMGMLAVLLKGGGIAVLPTDTIYGFHCLASSRTAVDDLIEIKGRDRDSGFILLASSMQMVDSLVAEWPGGAREILEICWPAPLTAILPASDRIMPVLSPNGKVALRIPSDEGLCELISMIGEPIVSTSVNRSGHPPLERISDIRKEFPGLQAYISRRGRGRAGSSTLIDLSSGRMEMIRQGIYRLDLDGFSFND